MRFRVAVIDIAVLFFYLVLDGVLGFQYGLTAVGLAIVFGSSGFAGV